jgi:hypothetical protein
MAQVTLLPQTGTQGTVGTAVLIGSASVLNVQFNPQNNIGFSGTVLLNGSVVPSPGVSDWFNLATVACSGQTTNFDIDMYLTAIPWVQVVLSAGTLGAISVYAAY